MKKLIQAIIDKWFCKHKWEVVGTSEFYRYPHSPGPWKTIKTVVCTECGKRIRETYL